MLHEMEPAARLRDTTDLSQGRVNVWDCAQRPGGEGRVELIRRKVKLSLVRPASSTLVELAAILGCAMRMHNAEGSTAAIL
jgi:hypothetical protein